MDYVVFEPLPKRTGLQMDKPNFLCLCGGWTKLHGKLAAMEERRHSDSEKFARMNLFLRNSPSYSMKSDPQDTCWMEAFPSCSCRENLTEVK